MIRSLAAYIRSMRLYYGFITGIAGWLGMSFYDYISTSDYRINEVEPSTDRKILILLMLFMSWGINQVVNDWLGLEEDRINAPERPMVTGELPVGFAISLSGILLLSGALFTWYYLEPIALIPYIAGPILNILYEKAKRYGFLGNLVFGLMIPLCTVFGFLAAGPTQAPWFTPSRTAILAVLVCMNALMTYYTYFKDFEGDRASGIRTLIVTMGLEKSRIVALFSAPLPMILFTILYQLKFIHIELNSTFILLAILTLFLELWTGWLYFKNPEGKMTYYSLAVNFRACACGQAAMIGLFKPELAICLFLITYIMVDFLFDLHKNPRS